MPEAWCIGYVGWAQAISSVGLLIDIAGAVLIFLYGLPADVRRTGAVFLCLEQDDVSERKKAVKYDHLARFGLGLLILGFLIQLVSNFL